MSFRHKAATWLLRYLQFQLFITLISLPIIISWGLPLSAASPIANCLFSPLLSAFLLLSSLLFFTELFCIPNGLLVTGLEKTTQLWLWLLSLGSKKWLIGFAQPSPLLLLMIPVIAFSIVLNKKFTKPMQRISMLSLALLSVFGYLRFLGTPHSLYTEIPCNKGHVVVVHANNQSALIDPGVIGQRISAPSWIEFTLIPELIKTTGSTTLDQVILLQPGQMLMQAIETLVTKHTVNTVYLIYWSGTVPKNEWRSYFAMRNACQKQGTNLKRLFAAERIITLSDEANITLASLEIELKHKDATFPALSATVLMPGVEQKILPTKYTKKP